MTFKTLSDFALLSKLTDSGLLSEENQVLFDKWFHRVARKEGKLSLKQRKLLEKEYHRLELDADEVLNLVSSGLCKVTEEDRQRKLPYELMPRPLKPPGK